MQLHSSTILHPCPGKKGFNFCSRILANSKQSFNISIYSNMAVMLSAQNCKVYFVSILKRDLDTNKTPSI